MSALRIASTKRRWPNGETTEHFWIELEPDSWVEVSRAPTLEEAERFRALQRERHTLRATTRYLRMQSDSSVFVSP